MEVRVLSSMSTLYLVTDGTMGLYKKTLIVLEVYTTTATARGPYED